MNRYIQNIFSLCFLSALAGLAPVLAQNSIQPPSGPLIKAPTANAHWFLEFSDKNPGSLQQGNTSVEPRVSSMEFSGSEGIRLIQTKFSNGKTETVYVIPGQRLIKRAQNEEIAVLDPLEKSLIEYDSPLGTFPGFDWINPTNFRGVATIGDQECYKYTRETPKSASTSSPVSADVVNASRSLITEAYIEKDTLLPVAYVNGNTIVTYRSVGVSALISLPDDYRKAIRKQAGYRTP